MSVYIKGMKMPKNCDSCLFDDGVHCMAYPPSEDIVYDIADGKPSWCPLVPVPPHGDLIDRDALPWEKQSLMEADEGWALPCVLIEDAPTIIEAEGEE